MNWLFWHDDKSTTQDQDQKTINFSFIPIVLSDLNIKVIKITFKFKKLTATILYDTKQKTFWYSNNTLTYFSRKVLPWLAKFF